MGSLTVQVAVLGGEESPRTLEGKRIAISIYGIASISTLLAIIIQHGCVHTVFPIEECHMATRLVVMVGQRTAAGVGGRSREQLEGLKQLPLCCRDNEM